MIFEVLVNSLVTVHGEQPWVEHKHNNADPEEIGEYISALANTAAHQSRPYGYVVWGVDDDSRELVGTTFDPLARQIGAEELHHWLLRMTTPRVDFEFRTGEVGGHSAVVLVIPRASTSPVLFKGTAFIRVGTYKKRLSQNPQIEAKLWKTFEGTSYEAQVVVDGLTAQQVVETLDIDAYFRLLGSVPSADEGEVLRTLADDRMILPDDVGRWSITGLGGLTLARRFDRVPAITRKAVRFVRYSGTNRGSEVADSHDGVLGYAVGFPRLVSYIRQQLPRREVVDPVRRWVDSYPSTTVRELVANALIHQDFTVTGSGPLIELFADRLEISNPGVPLMAADRLLDTPPRSRNEGLAGFMRRVGICEERGSGVDRAMFAAEVEQLPAPDFRVAGENTISVIYGPRSLEQMDRHERIRAVYWHSTLRFVNGEEATNTTVRQRFGLEDPSKASRLLGEAVEVGVIKLQDPGGGKRYAKYVPYWA